MKLHPLSGPFDFRITFHNEKLLLWRQNLSHLLHLRKNGSGSSRMCAMKELTRSNPAPSLRAVMEFPFLSKPLYPTLSRGSRGCSLRGNAARRSAVSGSGQPGRSAAEDAKVNENPRYSPRYICRASVNDPWPHGMKGTLHNLAARLQALQTHLWINRPEQIARVKRTAEFEAVHWDLSFTLPHSTPSSNSLWLWQEEKAKPPLVPAVSVAKQNEIFEYVYLTAISIKGTLRESFIEENNL